jgi:hypothetical protein
MENKEKENRIKTKTLGLIIFLACTILAVSSGKLIAQDQISVRLEANASADCFPASALHLEDLRIVLSKSCPECSYENEENEIDAFRFVVEDPFLGWSVTVYDKDGNSIGQIHWSGGLDVGFKKAVGLLRAHLKHQAEMKMATNRSESSESI